MKKYSLKHIEIKDKHYILFFNNTDTFMSIKIQASNNGMTHEAIHIQLLIDEKEIHRLSINVYDDWNKFDLCLWDCNFNTYVEI